MYHKFPIEDEINNSIINESEWDEFKSFKAPSTATIHTHKTLKRKETLRFMKNEKY